MEVVDGGACGWGLVIVMLIVTSIRCLPALVVGNSHKRATSMLC